MSLGSKKTGFRLTELLVVIAMTAVLAAILLPVFAQTQQETAATKCLNNVKQLSKALRMYLGEWDNVFPIATGEEQKFPSPAPTVGKALLPYLENNYELFRCPTDNVQRPAGYHPCTYGFGRVSSVECYDWGYCGYYVKKEDGTKHLSPSKRLQDIRSPVNFVCIMELAEIEEFAEEIAPRCLAEGPAYNARGCGEFGKADMSVTYSFRHGDNGNFAFADGHVKALSKKLPCTAVDGYFSPPMYCVELDHKYTMCRSGPWKAGDACYKAPTQ